MAGSQSTKHVRLTLENILAEISGSEMVGPFGIGPVFSTKETILNDNWGQSDFAC